MMPCMRCAMSAANRGPTTSTEQCRPTPRRAPPRKLNRETDEARRTRCVLGSELRHDEENGQRAETKIDSEPDHEERC